MGELHPKPVQVVRSGEHRRAELKRLSDWCFALTQERSYPAARAHAATSHFLTLRAVPRSRVPGIVHLGRKSASPSGPRSSAQSATSNHTREPGGAGHRGAHSTL
jgi:hypothetical protein